MQEEEHSRNRLPSSWVYVLMLYMFMSKFSLLTCNSPKELATLTILVNISKYLLIAKNVTHKYVHPTIVLSSI